MRKKIGLLSWFLGVCCVIIGCVSPTSWIGVSDDAVITRFGLPEKSYTTNDCRKTSASLKIRSQRPPFL